jgi:hypothetical protein
VMLPSARRFHIRHFFFQARIQSRDEFIELLL